MNENIYYYVLIASEAVQLSLAFILVSIKRQETDTNGTYRVASLFLACVFLIMSTDQSLSMLANKYDGWGMHRVDTVVDVLCYTPIAMFFYASVRLLLTSGYDYRRGVRRDFLIWLGTTLIVVPTLFISSDIVSTAFFSILIILWGAYILYIAYNVYKIYSAATLRVDEYFSDDKRKYISLLRNGLLAFLVWGIFSPAVSVASVTVNTIYVFLGIFVNVYMATCFINYVGGLRYIEESKALQTPEGNNSGRLTADELMILSNIRKWEDNEHGYRKIGVSIEDLAESVGSTTEKVIHIIRAAEGRTFKSYIDHLRIADAQELLISLPDDSPAQIATMLGYNNTADFVAQFKEITTTSPEEWRHGVFELMKN